MATEVANTNSFYDDCLILNHKEVGLLDLIKLLFFKDIGSRKFIECHHDDTVEESFARRFVIFISIVAQKFLDLVNKPMGWVGSAFEFIPNLKHANGGFLNLLRNLLTGKMVQMPDKESSEFLTVIGRLDIRRDLDSRIKHDDPRYKSALAIMAAKAAYENQAYIKQTVEKHWKMEFLGFFDCWNDYEEMNTTQGFMWSVKTGDYELIGVSFRGTSPFDAKDWSTDVDLSWYHLQGIGKVHAGFLKALGLQNGKGWPNDIKSSEKKHYAYYLIRQKLKDRLESNPNAKFFVTGHSLGGALSILFPAILAHHKEIDLLSKLEGVYTFGQPRVGDRKFGEYMKEVIKTHGFMYQRFVYCNDLVPRVPFDNSSLLFKHFGDCHYYDSNYKGQVVAEEPNKNYFSIFALVPMFTNAFWELLRSFKDGRRETFTCRGGRVIGLLIAGLPAHGPQEYVNITIYGSSEFFKISSVPTVSNIK